MSKYKNNVIYYQDVLTDRMDINIKHISNGSKASEKDVRQESLLHKWHANELRQEEWSREG